MDVFYEESSISSDVTKGSKKYAVWNVISKVFLTIGIIFLFLTLMIPMGMLVFWLVMTASFFLFWWWARRLKMRYNVNYDYSFVSGELRIARVFNVNKRKLVARFDSEEIIQLGDVENPSYDRFAADPTVKTVICTSNDEPSEGKFFMYALVEQDGKKLYVLECRETLLMHMMRFVKRGVLESDYVMQEKKQNR